MGLPLDRTRYLPLDRGTVINGNLLETEAGLVNDYNCRFLGGVTGNAGLFSTLSDLTQYARMLCKTGNPLVSPEVSGKQSKTIRRIKRNRGG